MPATIHVESGISAGTSIWIDRPVLRVGSDPQCDVCLPSAELAPHALTLEFRDGAYRVYNRGAAPVNVGGSLIHSGAGAAWQPDDTIQLPGDLRLVLSIDGDPRPAPRPDSHYEDGFNAAAEPDLAEAAVDGESADAATQKKKSTSSLIQVAIIIGCIAAVAGMLMMKRGGSSGDKPSADRPTFEQIVQDSLSKDASYRAIVRRLQYAQAAIVRFGDRGNKVARERFATLRDQLVHHVDNLQGDAKTDVERVLSYVEYRLGRM